ncbi:MAG: YhgE/Pip domain-containing protein [Eggerthellaceae bacterium]|nr:YhgE/Pip domain-containing protein [Eggerthellaceae bacterium]
MNNVWHLFKDDLARLRSNVVTIIAVLGLVALPSIFSWYNIIACWDVFGNTGNLTVAVANSDEGYESDLVPLRVNIGEQITSALRANDQLDWVFTDEEDAIDGARSGRYYAAVVIPSSFSADMMSFYSDDVVHASITYYSNQKKGAIAPKITDQGADQVSAQVNEVFAETISEIALGISSTLFSYADDSDATGRIGELATHVESLGSQMGQAASTLSSYSTLLGSAQDLVSGTASLIADAQSAASDTAAAVAAAQNSAEQSAAAMRDATAQLNDAVDSSAVTYDGVPASVDNAFNQAAASAAQSETLLRDQAAVAEAAGDSARAQALYKAADDIAAANASTESARGETQQLASQAQQDLASAKASYDENLKPTLEQIAAVVSEASASISSAASTLDATTGDLTGSANSISNQLADSRSKLDAAITELRDSATKLNGLSKSIADALASDDIEKLRTIIGSDPAALATAIAAPVKLERHAVYPVENFGSAMSPLYTTLALWIGALLVMVTLRVIPSQRSLRELDNPTAREIFLGRFLTIAFVSLMQSTCLSLGNLLFLGVQAVHPFLYVLCFWVSGLVFAFIIYTMVALFANLGKALGVVLLIVQVAGGGGSFPLQLLPSFFQNISPFLPITHAVSAMRAAMFGIYQADYWVQLGELLLFVIPLALLGLVLHKPLGLIVPKFVERVEKSKLM